MNERRLGALGVGSFDEFCEGLSFIGISVSFLETLDGLRAHSRVDEIVRELGS